MNRLCDNLVRTTYFDGYVGKNIVRLAVQLGLDVVIRTHVKLKNVFVRDDEAVRDFFNKLNNEAPMTIQLHERPAHMTYALVDLYDANGINLNRQMLELGIATPWNDGSVEERD